MAVRRTKVSTPAEETVEEPKSAASTARRSFSGGGWGAPSSPKRETVKAAWLDTKSGTRVIKILNDEPTVWYLQHFVGKGKPPVICYRSPIAACEEYKKETDNECPLCEVGASASYGYLINVIDLTEDNDTVRKWTFGRMISDQLRSFAEEPATSPLNRETDDQGRYRPLYWMVRQTKSDGKTQTMISPLKAADLRDDYDIEPPTEDQIETLAEKSYGDEALFISMPNKMKEFAKGYEAAQND